MTTIQTNKTTLNRALITGASGGIGLELAKIHAAKGKDLILVARSEGKLNQIKDELEQKHNINVVVIVSDLAEPNAANDIYHKTQELGLEVDILINNAGFGGHGFFHERALNAEQAMIQVNITALTDLAHFYVKDMVKRGKGQILNVSSTASFIPGPLQAVYYATKSYVASFSQALAEEVSGHGVTVTALCPGAVKTGFAAAGDLNGVAVFEKGKSAVSVAKVGYSAMERGELLAFNELGLKLLLKWVIPLLPKKAVLKMSRQSMEKTA